MAITLRRPARRPSFTRLVLTAWAVVAVMAVLPVAAAMVAEVFGSGVTRTAFATAPAGSYAVVSRAERESDTFYVVPAAGGEPLRVATVGHLPGYIAKGVVSPDGRKLAVVAVDAGTPAHPGASLLLVDLESGGVTRLAVEVDSLQTPAWTPASDGIVMTRSVEREGGPADVVILRVGLAPGQETVLWTATGVLGAYPIGYDAGGRLLAAVIDGRGSAIVRDGVEVLWLGPAITRDWRLAPDGSAIAYVEVETAHGLQYRPHTVALGGSGGVSAQSAADGGEGLGVAWKPGGQGVTFGREPGGVSAQGAAGGGFDVPLAWSPDGESLAVQRWTGSSYADAGSMSLEIASAGGRRSLEQFSRFHGWAAR